MRFPISIRSMFCMDIDNIIDRDSHSGSSSIVKSWFFRSCPYLNISNRVKDIVRYFSIHTVNKRLHNNHDSQKIKATEFYCKMS